MMRPEGSYGRAAVRWRALALAALVALAAAGALASCERQPEARRADAQQAAPAVLPASRQVSGAIGRVSIQPGAPLPRQEIENPFRGNPQAIREGERLYNWYNCGGCHGGTGGAIGPNLQDGEFIYGGNAVSLFSTIYQGRPNGMPTWGGMIPEPQIWQIVAYLQDVNAGHLPERAQQGRGGL